ncbi:YnbE family lipoprotein [Dongia sp.]|uniref:YnbE family lipoprotein n=1 Tax=Dongia sp. TaxID=1977262 RepID=UPI0035B30279
MMKGHNVPQPAQSRVILLAPILLMAFGLAACNPTVKVEAPDKPIVINLNVKIEQEVRIKVDKDVEDLVQSNPALF